VCQYVEQCGYSSSVVDAIRAANVNGQDVAEGAWLGASRCHSTWHAGITDGDLAELGIGSRLVRKSLLRTFGELLVRKGVLVL
jgi:hypothetical protein